MKLYVLIATVFLFQLTNIAQAGSLADGGWKPVNCGEKPKPPAVDGKDVDGFNKSVEATRTSLDAAKKKLDKK